MVRTTDKFAFFYSGWPSNFYKARFEWTCFGETHCFFCTEQAFMWAKAKTFNDGEVAEQILAEQDDPKKVKALGRKVRGYDNGTWGRVRYGYMLQANRAKYEQNEGLKLKLLDPEYAGLIFVEASPWDGIWGIQMRIDMPGIEDERNWRGANLLGKVLTQVRDELACAQAAVSKNEQT